MPSWMKWTIAIAIGAGIIGLGFRLEVCMRRRVIAGNWKMYKTLAETRAFFSAFTPLLANSKHCDIVIAPPFTAIATAAEAAKNTNIAISGQNVSWSKEGAFTGEVSATMLAEAGCRFVIIGHSSGRLTTTLQKKV